MNSNKINNNQNIKNTNSFNIDNFNYKEQKIVSQNVNNRENKNLLENRYYIYNKEQDRHVYKNDNLIINKNDDFLIENNMFKVNENIPKSYANSNNCSNEYFNINLNEFGNLKKNFIQKQENINIREFEDDHKIKKKYSSLNLFSDISVKYYSYKLFDSNGENLDKLNYLSSYQNNYKVKLFDSNDNENKKFEYSDKDNNIRMSNGDNLSFEQSDQNRNCYGPQINKISHRGRNFKPY